MSGPLTFLVASPHLRGSLFEGSVILLLEHDTKGAMGLIINFPTDQSVSTLLPDLPAQEQTASFGGPVDPSLGWCLYQYPLNLPGELQLVPGLNVSSSLEVLNDVIASGQPYRLLLGYCGWSSGQLSDEAREGTWVWVEQDTPDLVWSVPHEQVWQEALKRLGVSASTIMPGGAQA